MAGQQCIKNGCEFDCNTVTYGEPTINKSGGKAVKILSDKTMLHLSTHSMLTWGMQEFVDDNTGRKSYNMALQFDDDDRSQKLLTNLKALEHKLKTDCVKHCKKWMNKSTLSPEVADALFHPMLTYPKNKDTGEPDYDRNPTLRIKMDCWDDKFTFEIYDVHSEPLFQPEIKEDIHPLDLITKLSKVMTIIKCGGLWFANGKFGCTWRLVQAVVKPGETLTGKCHIQVSPEDIKEIEANNKANSESEKEKTHSTIVEDSDDEEPVQIDTSTTPPEPEPEQEPEQEVEATPQKKKVVRKKKTTD